MRVDYDKDQLAYALANALKERHEAREKAASWIREWRELRELWRTLDRAVNNLMRELAQLKEETETKRQLDEAERKLSRIYRWVEKHNQDGFIDSLTHVQNIDLCFDCLYDKLEIAERQKNRAIKHLTEMEKAK